MNEQNDNRQQNGGNRNPKNSNTIMIMVTAAIITLLVVSLFSSLVSSQSSNYVEYSKFVEMLENGKLHTVLLDESSLKITFTLKPDEKLDKDSLAYITQLKTKYYTNMSSFDIELISRLESADLEKYDVKLSDTGATIFAFLISYVLPIVLVWVFLGFMMRRAGGGGGVMGVGKSNAKRYDMQKDRCYL